MTARGDAARLHHALTSYVPERRWDVPADDPRVLRDFVPNDLDRLPAACKAYADGLPRVALPREWPPEETAATQVLAGRAVPEGGRVDAVALARLLFLTAGVVRESVRDGGKLFLYRAAGSAGGRFPLELYVSARGVVGVPDGVHWYDPVEHALVQVGPAASGEATAIVLTGVPWRTGWRYAERGWRHVYWDAGTALSHLLALAGSAGLAPRMWTEFPDSGTARLVGADGVHEFPVAVVGLGEGAPAIEAQGPAEHGAVDAAPLEFPLVTQAQRAGDGATLGDPWPAPAPLAADTPGSADLDAVILDRGSTRVMDPGARVARAVLDQALDLSLRGTRVPHFVAVHGVQGVRPGLYRWPDLTAPRRAGDMRAELLRVCLNQSLAHDAAFVVIAATDLATLDDRGYREAQLAAGLVEGRLHLAAHALGIGASGMTFIDSEIPGLLQEPLAGLLFTCVGVPTYTRKRGGRPGRPVRVRQPRRTDAAPRE